MHTWTLFTNSYTHGCICSTQRSHLPHIVRRERLPGHINWRSNRPKNRIQKAHVLDVNPHPRDLLGDNVVLLTELRPPSFVRMEERPMIGITISKKYMYHYCVLKIFETQILEFPQ